MLLCIECISLFHLFVAFNERLGDCRSAKIALAMNGLLVGDRNIRVSLAKSGASGDRQRPTRASVGYEQPPAYYAPQSAYPAQPFSAGYAPRYAGAPPGPAYAGYPAPAGYPIYGAQNPFDAPGSSRSAAVASYGGVSGRAAGGTHHDASLVARTVFVEHWDPAYNEDVGDQQLSLPPPLHLPVLCECCIWLARTPWITAHSSMRSFPANIPSTENAHPPGLYSSPGFAMPVPICSFSSDE